MANDTADEAEPAPKSNAFLKTLTALAAVPKAEIDALEAQREKRPRRAQQSEITERSEIVED